jgi:hypothetical protein
MRNSGPGSQRSGEQGRFRDLFATGARALGCASVHIQAIGALGCACHRNRDQFAELSWDGAIVPPNCLIELYEGGKLRGRELLELNQPL